MPDVAIDQVWSLSPIIGIMNYVFREMLTLKQSVLIRHNFMDSLTVWNWQ